MLLFQCSRVNIVEGVDHSDFDLNECRKERDDFIADNNASYF